MTYVRFGRGDLNGIGREGDTPRAPEEWMQLGENLSTRIEQANQKLCGG